MSKGRLSRGNEISRGVRVGAVILISLLLLAYGIVQVGGLLDLFARRYPLVTLVENAGGLVEGAAVTVAGQHVGKVEEIGFIPVEERVAGANLFIRMLINVRVQDQIRRDSEATLRTRGLLGDRFVEISPGSHPFPPLQPGDTVPSQSPLDYEEVLQTAAAALDQVHAVVLDVKGITGSLARGEGTLGGLISDDRLYQRVAGAATELDGLIRRIHRGDGTMGRLVRDPALYHRLDQALERLDALADAMLTGQGTLGRFIHDDAIYESLLGVIGRADTVVAGVEDLVAGVGDADGTLARLLEDPELYDQLLRAMIDIQNLIRDIRENPRRFRPEVNIEVF